MQRRGFITLIGSAAAAWPLVARGQQSKRKRRVAALVNIADGDPQAPARLTAIRNGLREHGWTDNVLVSRRNSRPLKADASGISPEEDARHRCCAGRSVAATPFCHPQLQAVAHWFRDRHSHNGRFKISSATLRDSCERGASTEQCG